jgi:LysM repeat protein
MTSAHTKLAATAFGAATIATLLGTHVPRPPGPLTTWSGEQLALVAAWAVALLATVWISATGTIALVALVVRSGTAVSVTRACAPRFVRHIVEASLVATLVVAPARAAIAAPPSPVAMAGDEPVVRAPAPAPPQPVTKPVDPPKPKPASQPRAGRTHVVMPGDNLWRIAEAELIARGRPNPEVATVAQYWLIVIERNRDALRSHDPNLIYPGETIALPEPR